jgi:hypothetical protein
MTVLINGLSALLYSLMTLTQTNMREIEGRFRFSGHVAYCLKGRVCRIFFLGSRHFAS